MAIQRGIFGKLPDGRTAELFTLTNANGMKAVITNYGGIITQIHAPDKKGKTADVTLGYDTLEPYLINPCFMGALVGRYANRIAKARFELNGKVYTLYKNDGNNHLHGGAVGFDKKLWNAKIVTEKGQEKLELTYRSADGEEGYPGTLDVKVLYSLSDDGALALEYFAETDKDTVVNLTNHAYFNLAGHDSGTVENHVFQVFADKFTIVDAECIPTGELRSVEGTLFDFRKPFRLGEGLAKEAGDEQMRCGNGYDHNFVLNAWGKGLTKVAELYEPQSGRRMEVYTDKPGLQLYTGNFVGGAGAPAGKGGVQYIRRGGLCLETQFFPDSPNRKEFPSAVLKAGEKYRFTTIYRFSADK